MTQLRHCRHYSYQFDDFVSGARGPQCAAGVDLSGPGASRPCMPLPIEGKPCPSRDDWTDQERSCAITVRRAAMNRLSIGLAALPPRAKDKSDWGACGEVKCPSCETGMIQWSHSIRNGHLHARCTAGCFEVLT